MALTYGFYNSVEGDRKYDAIQMGQIFDGIITDGVYATFLKAMVVKASENASEVIVQPGRCWFNHTWTYIDADYPVEAPAPEVILDRVDALVLDINSENAFRANSLIWVQGTPSSLNPERPTLIKSVTHNQYPLAYVYRKAGTTMIYAADITNAVGTSETPFVTGVLEGINIDDLLAQWDDEFHTWEAATKTSFEAWMVNQQSVYVTWFNSIKDQMEGDLTDFEAWFETIRGIIDEEAATHLQAEIDELRDMLPAGSHIDISTTESTLLNRNVTVSDGVHSKTVQFDASGAATVESFPYIGIIDVSSTDGERTASEVLNIPYFGRYSAVLAFWSATVNLVGDEPLAAIPVTVRDSNGDVVAVVTLNASGQGIFTATKPDEYKFIYTYGGRTMEVSLAVTQETTYEVELHGGFRFDIWLETGRVSETFDTLDEVLADEPTLRQLFLVHDSVDYICNTFSESATSALADITKIFNTDLAAKWINLSDYALDHFYAVPGIKSIMNMADKYGYGEWALLPQVPTMTSNTAPYGEASASSTWGGGGGAYVAFDGNSSTFWSSNAASTGTLTYKFVVPICAKHIRMLARFVSPHPCMKDFDVKASNDGTTFTTLGSFTYADNNEAQEFDIENENYYLYYQISSTATYATYNPGITELQFYAWAPKGNVPVMTANNVPYGEASVYRTGTNGGAAWNVFDGNDSTAYSNRTGRNTNDYVRYKFTNPVCVKKVKFLHAQNTTETQYVKVRASNDGTNFVELGSFTLPYNEYASNLSMNYLDVGSNDDYYLYYEVKNNDSPTGSPWWTIYSLQFYGRELKVSVPTMTSNTAPFGQVIYHEQNSNTSYHAFRAFDYQDSTYWSTINTTTGFIGYIFPSNTVIKKVYIKNIATNDNPHIKNFTLQALNSNNEWVDTTATLTKTSGNAVANWYDIATDIPSKGHRLRIIDAYLTTWMGVAGIQFYGLDYSEKEFEAGTTKKWLYDHGVELETIQLNPNGTSITKESDGIYMVDSVKDAWPNINANVNVADYNLIRAKIGEKYYDANDVKYSPLLLAVNGDSGESTKYLYNCHSDFPNNLSLDVSNNNTSNGVRVGIRNDAATSAISIKVIEWWLE